MENQDKSDNARKKRRSSLKQPRGPILEEFEEVLVSRHVKRVSFANSNFIKPFASDAEENTIWDTTIEEVVKHVDSTSSSSDQSTKRNNTNTTKLHQSIEITTLSNQGGDLSYAGDCDSTKLNETQMSEADMDLTLVDANTDANFNFTCTNVINMSVTCQAPNVFPTTSTNLPGNVGYQIPSENNMSLTCQIPLELPRNSHKTLFKSNPRMYQVSQIRDRSQTEKQNIYKTSDMSFTCQIPSNLTQDMSYTCQLPTSTDDTKIKAGRGTLMEQNMSFTCQVPSNALIAHNVVKKFNIQTMQQQDMSFNCQIPSKTVKSLTDNSAVVDKENIQNLSQEMKDHGPSVEEKNMSMTCQISQKVNSLTNHSIFVDKENIQNVSQVMQLHSSAVEEHNMSMTCQISPQSVNSLTNHSTFVDKENIKKLSRVLQEHSSLGDQQSIAMSMTCQIPAIQNEEKVKKSVLLQNTSYKLPSDPTKMSSNCVEMEKSLMQKHMSLTCQNSQKSLFDNNILKKGIAQVAEKRGTGKSFQITCQGPEDKVSFRKSSVDDQSRSTQDILRSAPNPINEQRDMECSVKMLRDSTDGSVITKNKLSSTETFNASRNLTASMIGNVDVTLSQAVAEEKAQQNNQPKVVHSQNVKGLPRQSFVDLKTPQTSFRLHDFVSPCVDDTQHLINCHYATPDQSNHTSYFADKEIDSSEPLLQHETPLLEVLPEFQEDEEKTEEKLIADIPSKPVLNDTYVISANKKKTENTFKTSNLSVAERKGSFSKMFDLDNFGFTPYDWSKVDNHLKAVEIEVLKANDAFSKSCQQYPLDGLKQQAGQIREGHQQIKQFLSTARMKQFDLQFEFKRKNVDNRDVAPETEKSEPTVTLLEKVQSHEKERADRKWKLLEGSEEKFRFSILRSIELSVVLDQNAGKIIKIGTKRILDKKKVLSRLLMAMFLRKLDFENVQSCLGDHMDIFSLLDYVQINAVKLLDFRRSFENLQYHTLHLLRLDDDFKASFKVTQSRLLLHLDISVQLTDDMDHFYGGNVTIIAKFPSEKVKPDDLKELISECPKGLSFLECFINQIDGYVASQLSEKIGAQS